MKDILPEIDCIGPFRMNMYRGEGNNKNSEHFSTDPGDYGRGIYWTNLSEMAEVYGKVSTKLIELSRVYFVPREKLMALIEEYRTCKMHDGQDKRLQGAQKLTDYFKSLGAEAVLTFGYESTDEYGLCVFKD